MIIHSSVVGPFLENVYLVGDPETRAGALIDPGADLLTIESMIQSSGLTVQFIFNTHAHVDHIGAVDRLMKKYLIPFYLHPGDETLLQKAGQYALLYGIEFHGSPEVTHWFQDNETIMLGNLSFTVIHTPGHTPGSCALYFASEKTVFTGDTLFRESIGRTDLPGGDYETIIQAIKEKLFTLPGDTTVYPGHGPTTTIDYEKTFNPFVR